MTIKIIIHRAVFLRCFILLEGKNSITVTMQAVSVITRHRYRLVMTFVNDKTFAEIVIFLWAVILQFSKVWGYFVLFCYGYKATLTQNFNAELLIQMTGEVRGLGTKFSSYAFVFRHLYLPECFGTMVTA